jgi:hypothetical protein
MAQAIPTQHPAVVLRSHYNHLRALLAVAIIAIAGLTASVVILATNDETDASGTSAQAIRTPTPEQPVAADVAPSQPRPTEEQTFPGLARQVLGIPLDAPRYGVDTDTPRPTEEQTFPGLACQARGLPIDCHGHYGSADKDTPGPEQYDGQMP